MYIKGNNWFHFLYCFQRVQKISINLHGTVYCVCVCIPKACSHCNAHLAESNSMRIECALVAYTLLFEIRGQWASTYVTMIAQLGFEQSRTLAPWCAVLSLFCCSSLLSCVLSIEGIRGEEDSR